MKFNSKNSFKSLDNILSSGKEYKIFNLKIAEKNGLDGISKLPKSLKVLLENLLRYEDELSGTKSQIEAIKNWLKTGLQTRQRLARYLGIMPQNISEVIVWQRMERMPFASGDGGRIQQRVVD